MKLLNDAQKIYELLNSMDDERFIGATCQPLCKRMAKRKEIVSHCKFKRLPFYKRLSENSIACLCIEPIENYR